MEPVIINKVANSSLMSLDLEDFYPTTEIVAFDLKPFLFMELVLKEKEFRAALTAFNYENLVQKTVALYCSADAIIPLWAYMLATTHLQPIAKTVCYGNPTQVLEKQMIANIEATITQEAYKDQRLVIKGCGKKQIPEGVYVAITYLLQPVVKSLMYGEPCSTVPVYKNKK